MGGDNAVGVSEAAAAIAAAGRELSRDAGDLAALEGRLAVMAATRILAMTAGMMVLAVAAWLFVLAAGAYALVGQGVSPIVVLAGIGLINLTAVWVLYRTVQRLTRHLTFPATRRFLLLGGDRAAAEAAD